MKGYSGKKVKVRENGVKNAEETIVGIFPSLKEGLKHYKSEGYEEVSKDVKYRTTFILDLTEKGMGIVKIEIDRYIKLGELGEGDLEPILEIEAISREVILYVATLLEFKETDLKDWGTSKLLDYRRKQIYQFYSFLNIIYYNEKEKFLQNLSLLASLIDLDSHSKNESKEKNKKRKK